MTALAAPSAGTSRRPPLHALGRAEHGVLCPWCREPLLYCAPGSTVHPDCWRDYTELRETRELIRQIQLRDGATCYLCGSAGWVIDRPRNARVTARLELEHVVPLWAVQALPVALRRAFYGPANLRLACPRHHRAKSSAETTIRAAVRRITQGTCHD